MSERKPLAGWVTRPTGPFGSNRSSLALARGLVAVVTHCPPTPAWWAIESKAGLPEGEAHGEIAAKLAAEDAARALLAELAEALGVELAAGPCRWTTSSGRHMYAAACGSDFDSADAWMTFCPACGGPVEVAE